MMMVSFSVSERHTDTQQAHLKEAQQVQEIPKVAMVDV